MAANHPKKENIRRVLSIALFSTGILDGCNIVLKTVMNQCIGMVFSKRNQVKQCTSNKKGDTGNKYFVESAKWVFKYIFGKNEEESQGQEHEITPKTRHAQHYSTFQIDHQRTRFCDNNRQSPMGHGSHTETAAQNSRASPRTMGSKIFPQKQPHGIRMHASYDYSR